MSTPADIAALAADVKARVDIVALIGRDTPLRKTGASHRGVCPIHGGTKSSLAVRAAKRSWRCYACGNHGDAVEWLRLHHGLSFREALTDLIQMTGLALPSGWAPRRPSKALPSKHCSARRPAREVEEQETLNREQAVARARELYFEARPAGGTLVETYLARGRGIDLSRLVGLDKNGDPWSGVPPILRYAPRVWHAETQTHHPAMLAPFQDRNGRMVGLHITYLARDGMGKAPVGPSKRMRGDCWHACIRFGVAGPRLRLAEGIENGLSVAVIEPGLPLWVAGDLGSMAGRARGRPTAHPSKPDIWVPSREPDMTAPGVWLPDMVRAIDLIEDADGEPFITGALQECAARRYHAMGLTVRRLRPPDGTDFNDALAALARQKSETGNQKSDVRPRHPGTQARARAERPESQVPGWGRPAPEGT